MAANDSVVVNFQDGNAQVVLGNRTLEIKRSDDSSAEYLCPVELVSAALGS